MNGLALSLTQPGETRRRTLRQPNFPLAGGIKPQGLYPMFFTPVLPGETLSQATYKATYVSSPVKSPLSGWWLETWLYYVRLTDIDRQLGQMFIGQLTSNAGYTAPADRPRYFTKSGQIDWCYMATEVVHKHHFRDTGEARRDIDGVPMIKRIANDWTESAIDESSIAGSEAALGNAEDVTPQLQAFLMMRQMGMSALSYEDYLKTYGVPSVKVEEGEPELLAYRRYWTLPSNVIDPATGLPTGSAYWRVDEKAEKPKVFKEPGFLIGFHAVRPKLFDGRQVWSRGASMWGFRDFIPSYTLTDPTAAIYNRDPFDMVEFTGTGAVNDSKEIYFDHRDLLSHGEQFINQASRLHVPKSTGRSFAPAAVAQDIRGQYATTSDVDGLFASATATDRFVDYEGIYSTQIKGHVTDYTPGR